MKDATLEAGLAKALSPDHADGLPCSSELYRYAAGEMIADEADRFRLHLAQCSGCRADLQLFHRSAEPQPVRWYHPAAWFGSRPLMAAAAITLVAALGVSLWAMRRTADTGRQLAVLRAKGAATLHLAVRRGELTFTAAEDTQFQDGDVLGFFYSAPVETWAVVLFVDHAGKVSRVFPTGQLELLPAAVERPVGTSAVVERATGCEWIVAFFSPRDSRPDMVELEAALRRAVAGRPPEATCPLPLTVPGNITASVVVLRRG